MAETTPGYQTTQTRRKTFAASLFGRIFKGFTVNLALEFLIRSIEENEKLSESEKEKAMDVLGSLAAILLPAE